MLRTIFAALFAFVFSAGMAAAQTCNSLPYNLTNGTTADATQVMANLTYVLTCANNQAAPALLQGYLGGLTLLNDPTNPNTVIDTAAGVATSDDVTTSMKLAAFAKSGSAWAVGTGNGCLDAGSSLAASTWYHVFVIANPTSGVVDEICTSSTVVPPAPAMPTGYTKKRRIGSFKTDGSARILGFKQVGDVFYWNVPVGDINTATTTQTNATISVPPGVSVMALIRAFAYQTANNGILLDSPLLPANIAGYYSLAMIANSQTAGEFQVLTNTSGQIRIYAAANGATFNESTYGWIDTRGRFN